MNARILADWVCGFSLDGVPEKTSGAAKDLLLDYLGVLLGGIAAESSARIALEYAGRMGGPPEASLFIKNHPRVSAGAAAFAHATAAHSIEMDDVHNASSLHPGVAVNPTALAVAEASDRSGRELLEAIIAGYEIILRVGEAANPSALYRRGFHPTAVCGVFSSAASAGKLLRLTPAQMIHAFGLAWSFASGNMSFQTEGSWAKRLQIGNAARCGIQAARLAALGATGPSHVFEENGFFQAYGGEYYPEKLTTDFGGKLKIAETGIKPFATCRYNQTPIDALLELRAEHRLNPDDVQRVDIEIASTGLPLVAIPAETKREPRTTEEAQFSIYHSAAVALVAGKAGVEEYREPWISDRRVRDLARRIHAAPSEAVDRLFPRKWAARVSVKLKDGKMIERFSEDCLGDPEKPMSHEKIAEKFNSLSSACIAAELRQAVVAFVKKMETKRQAADLAKLICNE